MFFSPQTSAILSAILFLFVAALLRTSQTDIWPNDSAEADQWPDD